MPNLKNNKSKLRSQLQIISACIMVVFLSVSTNIFHYEHFFFYLFIFLIVSQQVCGLLTGGKKDKLSKCFLFCIQQEHRFLFFFCFMCTFSFFFFHFFSLFFFFLSKKSSHDKKKHQWGHFIVLYSKSGWSQKLPLCVSSNTM